MVSAPQIGVHLRCVKIQAVSVTERRRIYDIEKKYASATGVNSLVTDCMNVSVVKEKLLD